jgi:biotin transport system permease protein
MMIGLYQPGSGPLHRLGVGPKLAGLFALSVAVFWINALPALLALLALAALALWSVRPPAEARAQGLWPLVPMLVLIFALQAWLDGIDPALRTCLRLAILILAAFAVSVSTRSDDLFEWVMRALGPFRRFGVDPDRIALVMALALRFVPLLAAEFADMRLAARARGVERMPVALFGAFVVRVLRFADDVAEALDGRGIPPGRDPR